MPARSAANEENRKHDESSNICGSGVRAAILLPANRGRDAAPTDAAPTDAAATLLAATGGYVRRHFADNGSC
jgi:hypothetical protein